MTVEITAPEVPNSGIKTILKNRFIKRAINKQIGNKYVFFVLVIPILKIKL